MRFPEANSFLGIKSGHVALQMPISVILVTNEDLRRQAFVTLNEKMFLLNELYISKFVFGIKIRSCGIANADFGNPRYKRGLVRFLEVFKR